MERAKLNLTGSSVLKVEVTENNLCQSTGGADQVTVRLGQRASPPWQPGEAIRCGAGCWQTHERTGTGQLPATRSRNNGLYR